MFEDNLASSDYLMKCVLRVIITTRKDLLPHVGLILDRLTFIIREISKNPSNPKFNHYTLECLSNLVKYVCPAQPELVNNFDQALSHQLKVRDIDDVG